MQIKQVEYQVLLPRKFWEQAQNKAELKKMITKYFSISYPNYSIKRIEKNGGFYMAICIRED